MGSREYQKENVKAVIDRINTEYVLPDIQRSFVWKDEQIYKLFDSLMRGYPISTFLFWELTKEQIKNIEEEIGFKLKMFKFVNSNKEKSEDVELNRDRYSFVLDGQQRLTALYIALKGKWQIQKKTNELYFNILNDGEENENGILYEFKFLEKEKDIYHIEKEKDKIKKIWINVKRIFEIESSSSANIRYFVEKIIEKDEMLKDYKDKISDNITNFYSILTNNSIINYYPEKEQNYDRVLDIFVRTNAGGTKLSYSDLLFSKIKLRWNKSREEFDALLNDINDNDFGFDIDFLLKTCLVIFSEKSEDVRYKIKNLNDSKIKNIKNNWEKISNSIKLVCDILKSDSIGIRHKKLLSSYNSIIPLIYFLYKNEFKGTGEFDRGISSLEMEKMRIWIYSVLLARVFGGQSDNILYKTKEVLDDNEDRLFPKEALNKSIKSIKSLDIPKEFLDKIRYNGSNSFILLSLIYPGLNFKPYSKGNLPQQDHMFSQSELIKQDLKKEKINDIGNIRYVGAGENNWKRDIPFEKWIVTLSKKEREKHFIPDGDWNVKNYEDFIRKRKELIFNEVRRLLE